MEKLYKVKYRYEAPFGYYDDMFITDIERWKEKVKEAVYSEIKINLWRFDDDKLAFGSDVENLSFDGWIDWVIENWVYFEEIKIDNYDDRGEINNDNYNSCTFRKN